MGPCLFLLEHLFCLSHRKIRWTMSVNNLGLEICLLGTLNFMVALTFCSWCKLKWSLDELKSHSQNFTRLWDNFTVHGVNSP